MTIKVGDKLPPGTLSEFVEVETAGCTIGPNDFKVEDLTRGKKVAIFGLPGRILLVRLGGWFVFLAGADGTFRM